ncbi:MAG: hypothetical protein ACD_19C00215G0002 [uncultured bacterium]|nr:MAG: hypothetical protein ACD_19C00215G0002 [uncultured bacterium]
MRCRSCDRELTDHEATRKYHDIKEYIDLCSYCFNQSDLSFHAIDTNEQLFSVKDNNEDNNW